MKKKTSDNASIFIHLYLFFFFFKICLDICLLDKVREEGWMYEIWWDFPLQEFLQSHLDLNEGKRELERWKRNKELLWMCPFPLLIQPRRETRQWVRAVMCRQHITTFLSVGPCYPSPSYRSQVSLWSVFFFPFIFPLSLQISSQHLSWRYEMLAEYHHTVWCH